MTARVRNAWITPKEEPEAIPFHREVPWWEVARVDVRVTDADYRVGRFIYLKLEDGDE